MKEKAFCPLWSAERVEDEIIVFVEEDGRIFGNLFFGGAEGVTIKDRNGNLLVEGKDYTVEGNRVYAIKEVPYFAQKWLKNQDVPHFIQNENATYNVDDCLLVSPAQLREYQFLASYNHRPCELLGLLSDRLELPLTYGKLKEQGRLNVALFGDSISNAANSSWEMGHSGFSHWADTAARVAEGLFGASISISNYSRSGYGTEWAKTAVDEKFTSPQDLVIIAFGMNDMAEGMTAEQFACNVAKLIELIKIKSPNAEFVLIAPPVANADFTAGYKVQPDYASALQGLVGRGVAVINMTAVFAELLKKKRYCEISGNNLNHPNDFGYAFYSDALAYLFYQLKIREENRLAYSEFFAVPTFEEGNFDLPENIKGGYIINEVYGKQCKTFAFVGNPVGVKGKAPAVVLVHGGGGNAYWKWVKKWTDCGYYAVAMDINCTHFTTTLEEREHNSLINDKLIRNYVCVENPPECSWTYYSVAQVISAHSYILSLPGVDSTKTGAVGISWGGVMSLIAIGVDKRFSLAGIIYSAGFISEDFLGLETGNIDSVYKKDYYDTYLDPRNYVSGVSIPVLFNSGLTDHAFSPISRRRTYSMMENVHLAIKHELYHDNESNFENKPVFTFFDDIVNNKKRPSLTGRVEKGRLILTSDTEGEAEVCFAGEYADPHAIMWEKGHLSLKKGENEWIIPEGVRIVTATLFYGDGLYVSCDLFSV